MPELYREGLRVSVRTVLDATLLEGHGGYKEDPLYDHRRAVRGDIYGGRPFDYACQYESPP